MCLKDKIKEHLEKRKIYQKDITLLLVKESVESVVQKVCVLLYIMFRYEMYYLRYGI